MNYNKSYKTYASELLHLALPILMGHFGFTLIFAGDVFVAAKYSTEVLAATSVSNSITSIIFIFGLGLLLSVSPILSNKLGAKESAKKYFYPTIKFSIICAFFTMLVIIASIPIMCNMGYSEQITQDLKSYTFIMAFSTFGGFLYAGLKEFLQAYKIVFVPNIIAIFGILLNLFLNYAFAFGWELFPEMGIDGLALASVLVRIAMSLSLLAYCYKKFELINDNSNYKKYYKNLVKIGLPISISISLEFLAFNSMAIIMGRVADIYAASQNILIVLTNTSFMIPLSLSAAIAVKVGFSNGAKNYDDVKKYGFIGSSMAVGFMIFCALIFAIFPEQLAKFFTNDKELIYIISKCLLVVACFQIFDGTQGSIGGIYKGLKKTNFLMLANFFCYILCGISIGVFFAFKLNLDLFGFWIGIASSSAILSLTLIIGLIFVYKNLRGDLNSTK